MVKMNTSLLRCILHGKTLQMKGRCLNVDYRTDGCVAKIASFTIKFDH